MNETILTNAIDELETKNRMKTILDTLANIVSKTAGPFGSNTIIQDIYKNHTFTKDGYTVLKSLRVNGDIEQTVFDLVLKISRNLVKTVGDGSTSSIIIANKLFTLLESFINNTENPWPYSRKDLIDILSHISDLITENLKNMSNKITNENRYEILNKIASLSLNNDDHAGKFIADIFEIDNNGNNINIEVPISNNKVLSYEIIDGYLINSGMIHNSLYTNLKEKETILGSDGKQVMVFMSKLELNYEDIDLIADILGHASANKFDLLLLAPSFDEAVVTFLIMNKHHFTKNNIDCKMASVKIPNFTELNKNKFIDLSYLINTKPYDSLSKRLDPSNDSDNKELYDDYLGLVDSVDINEDRTILNGFLKEEDNDNLKLLKLDIDRELKKRESMENETTTNVNKISDLKNRKKALECKVVNILVNGITNLEKENNKFLIEDAVYACQSAIEYGYSLAGTMNVPKILNDINIVNDILDSVKRKFFNLKITDDKVLINLINILNESFTSNFETILKNANYSYEKIKETLDIISSTSEIIYDVKEHKFVNIENTKVLTSAATEIEILKSIMSIITLIATSNQFITIN